MSSLKKMEVHFRMCCGILLLTTCPSTHSTGILFKVDNLQLTGPNEPIIQEDTIRCARESSCRHFKRILPSSMNTPFKDSITSTLHFEKMIAVYSSCMEALNRNWQYSGSYRIRHSNTDNYVLANCYSTEGKVVATFHHDAEAQTTITGYEASQSYRKPIKYEQDLGNIRHFVDSCLSCRQFVRIDCYHMRLTNFAALMDRDNKAMKYFGGGPQNATGCKCGIDKSCVMPNQLCNCDANDSVWRYDEGYITDKQRLPLTEVRLGDTGHAGEIGKFTVGPLECTEYQL